jgi:transcriptional regulator with XRE-family HTH domain
MKIIFELLNADESIEEIGRSIRLLRAEQGWRQEDLAVRSKVSLQAIKNLEGSGKVELKTFFKVARALHIDKSIWEVCQPVPETFDELDRIEWARNPHTRIRTAS